MTHRDLVRIGEFPPRRPSVCLTTVVAAAAVAGLWFTFADSPKASEPNDVLPEAPAKALVVRACVSCHPAPQIVAKRLSADEWDAMLAKMVDRGAQLSEPEQDEVYAYLVKYFGAPSPAGAPG